MAAPRDTPHTAAHHLRQREPGSDARRMGIESGWLPID